MQKQSFSPSLTKLFSGCHVSYEHPDVIKPSRAYAHDAGLDLALQETVTIQPGETAYVSSGVRFRLQPGYCVMVMTRSSTFRKGVTVIPTVIDAGYTGIASVIITNTSREPVTVHKGDRLAQAVLQCYSLFTVHNEKEFGNELSRGNNGLGSSGT